MKYVLLEDADSEIICELTEPFIGSRGSYIRTGAKTYQVRVCEWDYDQKIVFIYVDIVSKR
jgi:hypothetical protein